MTHDSRISTPLVLLASALVAFSAVTVARGADDPSSFTARPTVRPRQLHLAQSELKLIEPAKLPSSSRIYPVAQPEPIGAGPSTGAAGPDGKETPPMRTLPPTAKDSEEIDPSWKPIGAVTATITNPAGELPGDLAAPRFVKAGVIYAPANESRNWMASDYLWEAPGSVSGPLYFEEPNLERYGYQFGCLQPAVSAAHFFATIPLLPYKMAVHPPHECVYSLGYYRPGDCAPLQHERFHFQPDAAAAETGAVMGLILLFAH
jgi:hypothetical protein